MAAPNTSIRSAREARGLTQRYVAGRLGVSPAAVAKWELGVTTISVANLLALADLLGCSTDALLGRAPTEARAG